MSPPRIDNDCGTDKDIRNQAKKSLERIMAETLINPEVIHFLEEKGYTLLEDIGKEEGCTSKVFLANYRSGEINKLRIVKTRYII